MKSLVATAVVLFACLASPVYAGPIDLGNGLIDLGDGLIYDVAQDLTWVKDAQLARTLGQDSDGHFTWQEAHAWVDQLSYAGYDDWRMPHFFGLGPDYRVEPTTSELARMLTTVGWGWNEDGFYTGPRGAAMPFLNFCPEWDGCIYWVDAWGTYWIQVWESDIADWGAEGVPGIWAVRDGGRPENPETPHSVPEPLTAGLLGLGLVLAGLRFKVVR